MEQLDWEIRLTEVKKSEVWIPKATVMYIPVPYKTRRELVQMSSAV